MLSYRHYITALLQALLILFAFASCINDEITDGVTSSTPSEYYLYLQIHSVSDELQTRATHVDGGQDAANGDFVHGGEDEHKIGTNGNYVIFFDKDKNYFSIESLEEGHKDNPGHNPEISDDQNYIEAQYKTKVYPNENNEWPKYCLVILNGSGIITDDNALKNKTMSDIQDMVWSNVNPKAIGRTTDGLFTLTNSAYLDGEQKLCRVVELPEINFTKNEEKTDDDVLHVHVERMLAKFSYKENDTQKNHIYSPTDENIKMFNGYNPKENDPGDPNDPGSLKTIDIAPYCRIEVTGWGINALENQSHLFKKITKPGNYFTNWNSDKYFRSYWSEDPHYTTTDYPYYPWQNRFPVEKKDVAYYSGTANDVDRALINYSYDNFVSDTEGNGFDRVVYTPENTYDPTDFCNVNLPYYLDNRANVLAGTHLILCAELKVDQNIKEAGADADLNAVAPAGEYIATDLYRDRFGVYYKTLKECLAECIREFNYQLKAQSTMRYRYYRWDKTHDEDDGVELVAKPTGKYQLYDAQGNPVTWKSIMDLTDIVPAEATILNGDGKLMPWLDNMIDGWTIKSTTGENLVIYDGTYDFKLDEEYDKKGNTTELNKYRQEHLTRNVATTDDVKSLLYEWLGAIDHFSDGKMYYSAPVWHNTAGGKEQQDEAKQTDLGAFGVVRNSWYRYTLDDITHVGVPVDKPADPIVPNRVDRQDQLNFRIEILDWHRVGSTANILE